MHPQDARALSLSPADLVQVSNAHGLAILRLRITDTVQPGQVFAPIHWTGETAPSARIDDLVTAATDPVSGQPESKASTVSVARYDAAWYGFAVSRGPMRLTSPYWAMARTLNGYRAELSGKKPVGDWEAEAKRLFGAQQAAATAMIDTKRGRARVVLYSGGIMIAALFIASKPVAVIRDYLATLPGSDAVDAITGHPPATQPNPGPVLCSCFGTG